MSQKNQRFKLWRKLRRVVQKFNPMRFKRHSLKMMSIFAIWNTSLPREPFVNAIETSISEKTKVITRGDLPLPKPIFSLDKENDLPTKIKSINYPLTIQTGSGDKIQIDLKSNKPPTPRTSKKWNHSIFVWKRKGLQPSRQKKLSKRVAERERPSQVGNFQKLREQDQREAKLLAKTLLTKINTFHTLGIKDPVQAELLTSDIIQDLEQLLKLDPKRTKQLYDYLWVSNPFKERVRISSKEKLKLNQLYDDHFKELSFREKAYFIQKLKEDLKDQFNT